MGYFLTIPVVIKDKKVIKYFYKTDAPCSGEFPGSGDAMLTRFVLAFAVPALVAAFAGNLPATAHVTITKSVVVHGTALESGDLRSVDRIRQSDL